jgi:linoleoyl-CoA desaturase
VESYHPGSSITKVEAALFNKAQYVGVLQAPMEAVTDKAITATAPVAAYKRADDAFFLDVRTRVEAFIAAQGKTRYTYENLGAFEAAATLLLYVIAMYQVGVHGSWMWTIVLGILTGRMGFLMHMGNHCAVSHSPRINQLIGYFMDLIGSNATIWGYEHQVAHHVEPNEYQRDNDCEIGAPAVRMHPEVPHDPATMPNQHIIIPIAMTIGFFKWYVGDFGHFVRKQVGNVRMAIDREDWKMLLGFKGMWFLLHVAIPVYFCGWKLAMAQLFVFMALGGHYLENIFIVNHIQNGLVPPPGAHWANKQVLATANWKSGSPFWNFVSGGLNHQVEHHMFPSLSQYWYPHVAHIVKQTCLDHGLPYNNYPNFTEAWVAMWTFLRDVGQQDFVSKTGQKGAPAAVKKEA